MSATAPKQTSITKCHPVAADSQEQGHATSSTLAGAKCQVLVSIHSSVSATEAVANPVCVRVMQFTNWRLDMKPRLRSHSSNTTDTTHQHAVFQLLQTGVVAFLCCQRRQQLCPREGAQRCKGIIRQASERQLADVPCAIEFDGCECIGSWIHGSRLYPTFALVARVPALQLRSQGQFSKQLRKA